ncbi:MAG: SpoIIE family protein phosphatase [Spirochaetota bacterium]
MEFFNDFFINFYTLSTISGLLTWSLCLLFIYFLKDKSKSTKLLGWNIAFGAIVYYSYFFTQGFYAPYTVTRIITLIGILFFYVIQCQLLLHFPENTAPRFTKFTLYLQSVLAVGISALLIIKSRTAPVIYKFDGHYYEYDMPKTLKIYAAATLLIVLYTLFISIWRAIKSPKGERFAMLFFVVGVFIETIPSAIMNALNRAGFISRQLFFTMYVLVIIIGFFIVLITYINRTKDKTPFMFKIVSMSFLIMIVVFNLFSNIIMSSVDTTYDELKNSHKNLVVQSPSYYAQDASYLLRYNLQTQEADFLINREEDDLTKMTWLPELVNTYFFTKYAPQRLSQLNAAALEKLLLRKDMQYLKPYIQMLLQNREAFPQDTVASFYQKHEKLFFRTRNKLRDIPTAIFPEGAKSTLAKLSDTYKPFIDVIEKHLQNSQSTGNELKAEVLAYFSDFKPETHRHYREGKKMAYTSFQAYHVDTPTYLYEVGYSYRSYRAYIHNVGQKLAYLLLIAIALVVLGTPLFLSGALLLPLQALLQGLRKVQEGDLATQVPVYVQDEIGYLAGSFNTMVRSIQEAKEKLEEYSLTLEEKVEARTRELSLSFSEIEKLKDQQDGDYFLTTLLLKPLSINRAIKERKMHIDFFVKQKKEFQFRKRKHEIGGDICIAHDIKLKGKWYTAFLNADAMGKSMQGAGGILVLGAVFQSILQRTMNYAEQSNVYPEKWIKGAFKEMHKIFESFEGSMLISLIFGLVEESSGLVYYINAEHPWMILYRDGKASFIENDLYFRKLGTSGMKNDLFISTFQMMPGDMLVIGSDGKDDLVLESSEETGRVINEDETEFLNRVEEADGDLQKTFDIITGRHELMDDFSLLSIQYPLKEEYYREKARTRNLIQEARKEIRNKNVNGAVQLLEEAYYNDNKNPDIGKFLVKLYMKLKDYQKASKVSREYLDTNEVDTNLMIQASYSMKLNHEFDEAIEVAERVKLREPRNIRNLIHLADLYTYTRNLTRARKVLNKILNMEPNNQTAQRIANVLSAEEEKLVEK